MKTSEFDTVSLARDGFITTLTLRGTGNLNLCTSALLRDIESAARALFDDAETRVVIVKGGETHFCAGFDVAELDTGDDATLVQRRRVAELGGRAIRALRSIPQVTIASLTGAVIGGGACFATACDFRIANDTLQFGYPEVQLGINLQWNAAGLCLALCGPSKTKQLLIGGQMHSAKKMLDWGLIDEVTTEKEHAETVDALAQSYAALPPLAVQMIKRSVNALSDAQGAAILHAEHDQFLLAAHSEDFAEARAAFAEKRAGKFTGN